MQLRAGSAANGSHCLLHGSNSIHNIAAALGGSEVSLHVRKLGLQSKLWMQGLCLSQNAA